MPKTQPFEKYTRRYEDWFTDNRFAFRSEVNALRALLPEQGKGLEIGAGSGLFAHALDILFGLEPAAAMRHLAVERGIFMVGGTAEALPFKNNSFDFVLMVTTVCFLDDVNQAFAEAARVLKNKGVFLLGFIDKNSSLGRFYQTHKDESVFYRPATFFTVKEIEDYLRNQYFSQFKYRQTLFKPLNKITKEEPFKDGYGQGAFIALGAKH